MSGVPYEGVAGLAGGEKPCLHHRVAVAPKVVTSGRGQPGAVRGDQKRFDLITVTGESVPELPSCEIQDAHDPALASGGQPGAIRGDRQLRHLMRGVLDNVAVLPSCKVPDPYGPVGNTVSQPAASLAALFELPYCRISTIVERCGVSRPTAASWLNGLVEVGILTKLKIGRDRLFVNDRFLHVLTRDEMGD